MKIFVIGTGNLSHSLVPALKKAGHTVSGVYSRTKENLKNFAEKFNVKAVFEKDEIPSDSDIYIICTADSGISDSAKIFKTENIVLHTSGSTDIEVLKRYFKKCGVIYPVQTFTKTKTVDFSNVPLLIESSEKKTLEKIKILAQSLSSNIREMNSFQRLRLHLSAVFACNFSNNMLSVSKVLMQECGGDFSLLKPLIKETFEKALNSDPIVSQSGPAKRNDTAILNLHLKMLENYPVLKKIYSFVSLNIKEYDTFFKTNPL